MLRFQLRAPRKNLSQLGEGTGDEVLFAVVMSREGMRAHDDPVDVVSHVFEEGSAVAALKSLKDFANAVGCDSHFDILSFFVGHLAWTSSFISSLTRIFSSEHTESLISRHSAPSMRPATSLSNFRAE